MFLELPYFGRALNLMSVAKPLIYHSYTPLPNVHQMRRAYLRRFFFESESYTHPHICTRFVWLLTNSNWIEHTHAQLIRMGLNFSDLRGTGVSLILMQHNYHVRKKFTNFLGILPLKVVRLFVRVYNVHYMHLTIHYKHIDLKTFLTYFCIRINIRYLSIRFSILHSIFLKYLGISKKCFTRFCDKDCILLTNFKMI